MKKTEGVGLQSGQIRRAFRRVSPLFLLPTAVAFGIGFIWPFLHGLFLSFTRFKTTSKWQWVGFDNYREALGDESFRYSFVLTAVFAVVSLIIINVIAFALALALTRKIRGRNVFRTVFFSPNLIGGIVLGYIWSMLFDGILGRFNMSVLTDKSWGFWGLVILVAWQQIGYMMIIYIAGLGNVPGALLEAAKIDGANGWQTLFRVILPNVMSAVTVCLFLSLTNGFKLFDQNLALTGGLPYIINPDGSAVHTTELLALNIYDTFYSQNAAARGIAQAKAVLFFIMVAALGLLQLRATRRREVQQ